MDGHLVEGHLVYMPHLKICSGQTGALRDSFKPSNEPFITGGMAADRLAKWHNKQILSFSREECSVQFPAHIQFSICGCAEPGLPWVGVGREVLAAFFPPEADVIY